MLHVYAADEKLEEEL